ncbi:hypothetical protein HPB51_020305 [Rhipicephalus microplus]|uniref:Uncharacterized protein n=1 Tax=Rhipicephalus microplus TaxID=6941 RepID=A0A9J6DCN7_RHIMP|nr:hypothetical protein HPB51_020305 [Rhipicephalus microplus]
MEALADLKTKQEALAQTVADLTERLSAVEAFVESCDGSAVVSDVPRLIAETVKVQGQTLSARLDDLEDRSRRENVLFFGISDSPNETWAQSEGHVRDLLSRHLDMHISDSEVSRAHRLGSYGR